MKILKKIKELQEKLTDILLVLNKELFCFRLEPNSQPNGNYGDGDYVEIYSKNGGRRVCRVDEIYSSGEYGRADEFEKQELRKIAKTLDVKRSYRRKKQATEA